MVRRPARRAEHAVTRLAERLVFGSARFVSGALTIFGILGLLRTANGAFASSDGADFLGMTVNPLTSCIHLAAGLIGIAMATRLDSALRFLGIVGVAGIVFALLEFPLGDSGADIFGRDTNMAIAQLLLAGWSFGVWFWARSIVRTDSAARLDAERALDG
jgi:hypothetical protein